MRLCTCGHDESAHADEGVGPCIADKRNGDPCDCGRFKHERELAAQDLVAGSQYIGQEEKRLVEAGLVRAAALGAFERGDIPDAITMHLMNKDCGVQKSIKFELILEIVPCENKCRRLYYHAEGPFEFAGVPGQSWTVVL